MLSSVVPRIVPSSSRVARLAGLLILLTAACGHVAAQQATSGSGTSAGQRQTVSSVALQALLIPLGDALANAGSASRVSDDLDAFARAWSSAPEPQRPLSTQSNGEAQTTGSPPAAQNDAGAQGDRTAVDRALSEARTVVQQASATTEQRASALAALARAVNDFVAAASPSPAAGTGTASAQRHVVAPLASVVSLALADARRGDIERARANLTRFAAAWPQVENGVRAADASAYALVETNLALSRGALDAEPPRADQALSSLTALAAALDGYVNGTSSAGGNAPAGGAANMSAGATGASTESIATLLDLLRKARADVQSNDTQAAADALQQFIAGWPAVEGTVQAKSAATYTDLENEMIDAESKALSAGGAGAAGNAGAVPVIDRMIGQLEPFAGEVHYSFWDAALILLREGLEALLVLAALLAMLKKSGNEEKNRWVWWGLASGVIASVAFAVCIGLLISKAAAGSAREGIEGYVGIASVLLMLTVGAWLHRNANIKTWNAFIKNRVGRALATGSGWSLLAVAFLAVLREGAETVVFYVGIAPGISPVALLSGIGAAAVVLVAIGYLIVRMSVRLPIHHFFLVATVLIYYLAFKILGESVHALQVSGTLHVSLAPHAPTIPFLGIFPSWETLVPQIVVLGVVIAEVAITESKRIASARARAASESGSAKQKS